MDRRVHFPSSLDIQYERIGLLLQLCNELCAIQWQDCQAMTERDDAMLRDVLTAHQHLTAAQRRYKPRLEAARRRLQEVGIDGRVAYILEYERNGDAPEP